MSFTQKIEDLLEMNLSNFSRHEMRLLIDVIFRAFQSKQLFNNVELPTNDPSLAAILQHLSGCSIADGRSVITFGEGNQTGDISIRDVIKGDVIKFTININSTGSQIDNEAQPEKDFLVFANIKLDSINQYWKEVLPEKETLYPFNQKFSQYFYVTDLLSGDANNPVFDITVLNSTQSPLILQFIGVEITKLANIMHPYGVPEAVKVPKSECYEITMPDYREKFSGNIYHLLLPIDIRDTVKLQLLDPIYISPQAPYRYSLALKRYGSMPNHVVLRFWAKTHVQEHFSETVYLGLF